MRDAEEIRESLQDQVTGTVRWTETIEYLVDEERCDLFIELGPGGVLAGLLNRIRKGTLRLDQRLRVARSRARRAPRVARPSKTIG